MVDVVAAITIVDAAAADIKVLLVMDLMIVMDLWLTKGLNVIVNHRDAGQRGLAVVGVPTGKRREGSEKDIHENTNF